MANTSVQTIVEAAYVRSTSNDPGKLVTDAEAIGVVNRTYQILWAAKAQSNPAKHTVAANCVLAAGIGALAQDLIDIRRIEGIGSNGNNSVGSGNRVNLIPVEEKDRSWHIAPRVYRTGNNITSIGANGDPANNETLRVFYLDAPAALSALNNQLDDRYELRYQELLIIQLAVYISSKDTERDVNEWQKLIEERNMMLDMFMKQVAASTTALTTPLGGEIKQRLDSLYTSPSPKRA